MIHTIHEVTKWTGIALMAMGGVLRILIWRLERRVEREERERAIRRGRL